MSIFVEIFEKPVLKLFLQLGVHFDALMSRVCTVLLRNGHLFVVKVVVFVEYKVSEFFRNVNVTITSYGFISG